MHYRQSTKTILCILVLFIVLSGLSGCAANNNQKKYNELIQSYEKDENYENNTAAIKKHVQTANAGRDNPDINGQNSAKPASNTIPKPVLDKALKFVLRIANSGKLKGVPILIYHCIDTTVWGDKPMFVSPGNFKAQMKYLKDTGYTTITFRDLKQLSSIRKPVMITFDDGYEDNYTNAYPVLKEYGFTATIFLIVDKLNKPRFLNSQEIKTMQDIIDFQSHTMTHPHLAGLDPAKLEYELSESKKSLEKILDKNVDVIAYPYGNYDSTVIKTVEKYYSFGVTTNYGKFYDTPQDEYSVKRLYVINGMDLDNFIRLFR